MARGNFKRCRVLLGSNTNEGHYFIMYFLTNIFKKQVRKKGGREAFGHRTLSALLSQSRDREDKKAVVILFTFRQ